MKAPTRNQLISSVVLVIYFLAVTVSAVHADGNVGNTSDLFDCDGNLKPGVVDLGEQEIDGADWMNIDLGFTTIVPTGHEYLTPEGKTVFVPSASTLFAMAANPDESGFDAASGAVSTYDPIAMQAIAYGTMFGILAGNQGAIDQGFAIGEYMVNNAPSDILKNFFASYISGDYADAVNNNQNAWSLLNSDVINMLLQMISTDWSDKQLSTIYLLYEDCANSPTGCPANYCELVPNAASCQNGDGGNTGVVYVNPPTCPSATVTQGAVLLSIKPTAPNYPLVIGQDPEKRGADVAIQAIIQPTVYKYYTSDPVWGQVQVCPNDETTCKKEDMITTTVVVRRVCTLHTVVYPEQITSVRATAALTQGSTEWINQGLSAYYYGASVKQPNYTLVPGMAVANTGCNSGKVCSATATVSRIQFRDPGFYTLSLSVQTAGTPVSAPRTLNGSGSLSVAFISVRLIDTGN